MPTGRKDTVWIERSKEIVLKAQEIVNAGFRFECEMLPDYNTISLTIADDDRDCAIEVVPNGPEVPKAIDRMILNFNPSTTKPKEAA